jgi:hypothetical protein
MDFKRRLAAAVSAAFLTLLAAPAAPTGLAFAARSGGSHRVLVRGWIALRSLAHGGDGGNIMVLRLVEGDQSVGFLSQFPHVRSVVLG